MPFCNTCHPTQAVLLLHSLFCLSIPLSLPLAISFPCSPVPHPYGWIRRKQGCSSSVPFSPTCGESAWFSSSLSPGVIRAKAMFLDLEAVLQFPFCCQRLQLSRLHLEQAHPNPPGWDLPTARQGRLENRHTRKSWRKGTDGKRETT